MSGYCVIIKTKNSLCKSGIAEHEPEFFETYRTAKKYVAHQIYLYIIFDIRINKRNHTRKYQRIDIS